MIFDTSFIIDLMGNDKKAIEKYDELEKSGEPMLTTTLTIFEIFRGVARSKRPAEEKNKIIQALKGQLVVEFDEESAEKGGDIDGNLAKDGQSIGVVDSMIAGICLAKNEKLLTKNIKDFSKVKDLRIETY